MEAIDLALLVLRVWIGVTVALHGYNKVFRGGKLKGTAGWFESLGMKPGWLHARLAAGTELGAGLLLALGLFTPFAAAGIVGLMLVAAWTAHRKNGFFIFRPGEGWEYVAVLGVTAAAIAVTGPGEVSLDDAFDIVIHGWAAMGIGAGLGVAGGIALLAAFYRPPAKS